MVAEALAQPPVRAAGPLRPALAALPSTTLYAQGAPEGRAHGHARVSQQHDGPYLVEAHGDHLHYHAQKNLHAGAGKPRFRTETGVGCKFSHAESYMCG